MRLVSRLKPRANKAFTLTELLIALGILGLIATFALPPIMNNLGEQALHANINEAITTLDKAAYDAFLQGLYDQQKRPWFESKLNVEKICTTSACSGIAPIVGEQEEALVLHSGAVITGMGNGAFFQDNQYIIDGNGGAGPNTMGIDRMALNSPTFQADGTRQASATWHTNCLAVMPNWPANRTGWLCPTDAASAELYRKAFKLE
jgi:prepilin-type N-terminal cleavage/methylation domain-containing protein